MDGNVTVSDHNLFSFQMQFHQKHISKYVLYSLTYFRTCVEPLICVAVQAGPGPRMEGRR